LEVSVKDNFVFFLGGHDLEMDTINDLLLTKGYIPNDKKLSWGCKASAYKEELCNLKPAQVPILIELEIDVDLPTKAIIIDHHNEKSGFNNMTSIEQIADLLGLILNRRQQLISANDKAHIDGMVELNATEMEIEEIRTSDRKSQGITDKDEEYGRISIKHFLTKLDDDTVIVNSFTERTSIITDLLYKYYRHIFIVTPNKELHYSGTGQIVEQLIKKYSLLKEREKNLNYWYGGNLPVKGYFGSNASLKKEEIKELCNIMEGKRIQSQHIFMFPFTIEQSKQTNPSMKEIHESLKGSRWKYEPFKISLVQMEQNEAKKDSKRTISYSPDEIWAYNEYNYFHEFVRETLFTQKNETDLFKDPEASPVSLYYERDCAPNDEMMIFLKSNQTFTLSIDHLSLRVFETGIGILSITLKNYCYSSFDDVLLINDFGRRIYPQFFGEQTDKMEPVDATKGAFLPEKILFTVDGRPLEECFLTERYLNTCHKFASYLEELLNPLIPKYDLIPVIDDRMFTICWYGNNELMKEFQRQNDFGYNYENSDDWYKYIFIDGKVPLAQHKIFKETLIKGTTYPRFTEWGTLFGITRYSFMCMTDGEDIPYNIIRNHMQKIYYQMAVLLLAQRASIIKFNNDIRNISMDIREPEKNTKNKHKTDANNIVGRIRKLNADVIGFTNRIWFDEISPQEQGIELYRLAQDNMNIPKQLDSLRSRVNELDDYIEVKNDNENTEIIKKLTSLGAIFFPLTLWAAIFAIDKFTNGILGNKLHLCGENTNLYLLWLSLPLVIFYVFGLLRKSKIDRKTIWNDLIFVGRNTFVNVLLTILLIFIIIILI
jgi:hypothetical protein